MGQPIYTPDQVNEICEREELMLRDPDMWELWRANNQDGYGAGIFRYAERWAKCLQYAMFTDGECLTDVAKQLSFDVDDTGITGFMYGAAVQTLAVCWEYGEELRRWHNGDMGGDENTEGVIDPSVIAF